MWFMVKTITGYFVHVDIVKDMIWTDPDSETLPSTNTSLW